MQNFQHLAALYLQGWQFYTIQTKKQKVSSKLAFWDGSGERPSEGSSWRARQLCWLLVENDTFLSWWPRQPCLCLGQAGLSAQLSPRHPRVYLPCSAGPCSSCPWFCSENMQLSKAYCLSSFSYLTLQEDFLADKPHPPRIYVPAILLFFLLLIHLLPFFGSEWGFPDATEMSFLNCVYLLTLWCESALRQLHINLVSSVYLFPSASVPWPNLWLAFSLASYCHNDRESPGCSQTQDLSFQDELLWGTQFPAVGPAGLNLEQTFSSWFCTTKTSRNNVLRELPAVLGPISKQN